MNSSEIANEIQNSNEDWEKYENSKKERVNNDKNKKFKWVSANSKNDSKTRNLSVNVSKYVREIASSNSPSEAMELVNDFVSNIENGVKSLNDFDNKMKNLFDSLGKSSKADLSAREYIVSICSTKKVRSGYEVADWVYKMYQDLGYPIHRIEGLSTEDKMINLHQGERYIAREIPYQEGEGF